MTLTKSQCRLLIDMVKASILMAKNSGIPIGKEYYNDIDEIIDNAQIVKISYWDDGTFYEDITTLSPNTGWIEYKTTEDPGYPDWLIYVIIAIVLFALGIIVMFVKPIFNGIKAVVLILWNIIKIVFRILWFIIKYTIGLPITLLIRNREET